MNIADTGLTAKAVSLFCDLKNQQFYCTISYTIEITDIST